MGVSECKCCIVEKRHHDYVEKGPLLLGERYSLKGKDFKVIQALDRNAYSSESGKEEDDLPRTKVCSLGTKCRSRCEVHLSEEAHPFDPDYASLCEAAGIESEEPSLLGLYQWVDRDSSGKVSKQELLDAVPLLSSLNGENFVLSGNAWTRLDEDGNGYINFSEFAEWAGPRLGLPLGVKHLFKGRATDEFHGCAILGCPCEAFVSKTGSQASSTGFLGRATQRLALCKCGHKFSAHDMTLESEGEIPYPMYWDTRDSSNGDFSDLVRVDEQSIKLFQDMINETYRNIWTRDRKKHNARNSRVPSRYQVVTAFRSENSKLWREYGVRRAQLIQDAASLAEQGGQAYALYSDVKSTNGWVKHGGMLADRLKPECNEWYLFHGTTPKAAESICRNDFNLNRAGSCTGTLYGRGIYFAESITKADEYSKPNENGEYAVILARVVGGNVHYIDAIEPDPEECLQSCIEGPYDCILGDREKCRNTFREFVFYDTENFFAEYIIHYRRIYERSSERASSKDVYERRASERAASKEVFERSSSKEGAAAGG